MQSLGHDHSSTFESSFSESQIQTVFLTNCRLDLSDARADNPFPPTLKISEIPPKPTHYELRWNIYPTRDGRNGGTHGYMRLKLKTEADAIRALVLTHECAQGFCYKRGGDGIMWSKTLTGSQNTLKLLQKSGFISPKQML